MNITHRAASAKNTQSIPQLHRSPPAPWAATAHSAQARGSLYRLAARAPRLPRAPRDRDAGLRLPFAKRIEGLEQYGTLLRAAHGEAKLLLSKLASR